MRKDQREGTKKPPTSNIKQFRDDNFVLDLLRLKIEYVEREEKKARKTYRKEKRELQRLVKGDARKRAWTNLRRKYLS